MDADESDRLVRLLPPIMLAGLVLRLWGSGNRGFWWDEIALWRESLTLTFESHSAVLPGIFAAALIPLSHASGVSPWLMGFIILLISETAFYPYQTPYIRHFRNLIGDSLTLNEGRIRVFRVLLLLVKIGAIYASIPFWQKIGVL